jgi:hypothetical protein
MTISVKHAFASAKADGADPTDVQPSNWNAAHAMQCASGFLVGRLTAGVGAVEEIPVTNFVGSVSPAFTGTATFVSLAASGTITAPDSSTWTSAGMNNVKSLGIGMSPTYALDVTSAAGVRFLGSSTETVIRMASSAGTIGYIGDAKDCYYSGASYNDFSVVATGALYFANASGSATLFCNGTTEVGRYASDGSFLVGTTTSVGGGAIAATGNVTAYYSDMRLKTKLGPIVDPIAMVRAMEGFYYEDNDLAVSLGYKRHRQVGLSAQSVQAVLPEVTDRAPISDKAGVELLTLHYDRIVAVLVEAIKVQAGQIDALNAKVCP